MYTIKKLFLILLAGLSLTMSNYAIQPSTAKLISVASGIGVGALVYYQSETNPYYQPETNPVAATIAGVCVAGLMYLITREFTPARKFERAKGLLSSAERGLFVYDMLMSDHLFFDAMHTAYAMYDLPYAVAYYDLTKRFDWLKSAYDLFDDSSAEGDPKLSSLVKEYQCRVSDLMRVIVDAIKRIKQRPEFIQQIKIYEQRILEAQHLQLEQRKVAAKENQACAQHRQADAQHRQADAQYAQAGW